MSARSDADIAAVRMMMDRLDLSVADISDDTSAATNVPTFGDYIPVVADSMPASRTRDHYQTYWTKVLAQPGWAERALNEPTPVELQGLCEVIKTQRLIRRNGRDGREVVRHVIDALTIWRRYSRRSSGQKTRSRKPKPATAASATRSTTRSCC